jgi:hypothetical protein
MICGVEIPWIAEFWGNLAQPHCPVKKDAVPVEHLDKTQKSS